VQILTLQRTSGVIQSTFARQSTTVPKAKKEKEAKDKDKEKSMTKRSQSQPALLRPMQHLESVGEVAGGGKRGPCMPRHLVYAPLKEYEGSSTSNLGDESGAAYGRCMREGGKERENARGDTPMSDSSSGSSLFSASVFRADAGGEGEGGDKVAEATSRQGTLKRTFTVKEREAEGGGAAAAAAAAADRGICWNRYQAPNPGLGFEV